MKKTNHTKKKAVGALALAVCLLVLTVFPQSVSGGVCEKALARCGADLLFPGILGLLISPVSFAAGAAGCLGGYSWCLNYYLRK